MVELTSLVGIDKKRKVCKDCGLPGHNNKKQLVCPIKIKEDNEKKDKIKEHILNIDCLEEYDDDEMFGLLAEKIGTTVNSCKTLYSEISADVWIDRRMDINRFIDNIHKCSCLNCGSVILEFSKNRIWRDKILCDCCWGSHIGEREIMWVEISEYKKIECYICNKIKKCNGERFHYDHLNMFDKNDSICCMVDRGDDMKDIFSEIDKCQILCLACHHIVTSIEQKSGFTRIKSSLTRKYNNEEITEEQYSGEKKKYQGIYEFKMKSIYEELTNTYINERK
tara:strand:- start:1646 stop:2485 length:840 start_codon:yes stop_codon:yes gene_type:complete